MSNLVRVQNHIKNSKVLFQMCDKSRALYNKAMFLARQHYFNNKNDDNTLNVFLFYIDLYRLLKHSEEYISMPSKSAQQTLKLVDKAWKSFRKSIKSYYKNPEKFKRKPKIPKYKKNQYQTVIFPFQNVSYKNGVIRLPKTKYKFKTKINKGQIKEIRLVPYCQKIKIEVVYEKPYMIYDNLENEKYIGIDIGVNNLAAITSNQDDIPSFLINGRCIKSINQYYHKKSSNLKSRLNVNNKKMKWSKRLDKLLYKRNQKINDYFHKTSRWIIDLCLQKHIKNIIIGHNNGWKQDIKIGKRNNQNFVSIPFNRLIHMIQYKAQQVGINVILTQQNYTSKVDHLALQKLCKHKEYLGKRVKRGLFKSSINKTLNADINGSIGILRKVVGDSFLEEITNRGLVYNPFKISYSL